VSCFRRNFCFVCLPQRDFHARGHLWQCLMHDAGWLQGQAGPSGQMLSLIEPPGKAPWHASSRKSGARKSRRHVLQPATPAVFESMFFATPAGGADRQKPATGQDQQLAGSAAASGSAAQSKSGVPEAALSSEENLSAFIDGLTPAEMKRLLFEVTTILPNIYLNVHIRADSLSARLLPLDEFGSMICDRRSKAS